ncbi:MAG: DNA-directed RNA polymerase subunit K [Candidatus Aenigmarchaeota archaeon ex4484_224]|nr:MAG: DNA-directed RNA polymerase subunit K [Candidatus Aenigmarchaeota archaeon ex4484_224]
MWPLDRLTRFEVARLISARALQISLGAPVLIKTDKKDPTEIAKEEFKALMVPMTVRRTLPNGEKVVIDIKRAIKNWLEDHSGNI